MEIDDSRDITPYYIEKTNGKVERKYTDHFMITTAWNMSLLAEKNRTYTMILDEKGTVKYREMLEKEKVSKLITNQDIRRTYPIWRSKVTETLERCKKKVKIQKKWKVCRKLTSAKKRISKKLKEKLTRIQVKELKEQREIINQQIEEEEHRKECTRIYKTVEAVQKGGGVNSNVFWEVMRKLDGKREEPAYADSQSPRITTDEEVKDVIKKLDPKKAKDATTWKNDTIIE